MIGVGDLQYVIALFLATGHIHNEKPVSGAIITPHPEMGKTELAISYSKTPFVEISSFSSGYGFKRDLFTKIAAGHIRHIVIPEMLQPLSHGRAFADTFVATLQVMIEDGISSIHSGFLREAKFAGDVAGVIFCMPQKAYAHYKSSWAMVGFLSRLVIITYTYNDDTVAKVFDYIREGKYESKTGIKIPFTGEYYDIALTPAVAQACEDLAKSIAGTARDSGILYGFRETKHIRRLVKANVVLDIVNEKRQSLTATMEDFKKVDNVSYLFNEQYNAVKQ